MTRCARLTLDPLEHSGTLWNTLEHSGTGVFNSAVDEVGCEMAIIKRYMHAYLN